MGIYNIYHELCNNNQQPCLMLELRTQNCFGRQDESRFCLELGEIVLEGSTKLKFRVYECTTL